MSFLEPWMLWALPAVALPILIHLIHKKRQRVVEWGAMMFLLAGAKMSKGWQRVRQFLLLALRTIAVAALVLALGRPIAGGWLGGLGGGRPDTILILLDRSASMSQELVPGGASRIEEGTKRIADALANLEASRLACIDSVTLQVTPLEAPEDLVGLPLAGSSDAHSDVPALLEVAASYLAANDSGRAEIWICSDGQSADWRAEDGRWTAIGDTLVGLGAGARVNVLNFEDQNEANLGVRVDQAEVLVGEDETELSLSLRVRASNKQREAESLPVAVHVGGARSVVPVELSGGEAVLTGHRLPIGEGDLPGWGYVELPPDGSPADDRYYFTYGAATVQETVIVAEEDEVAAVLEVAAEAPLFTGTEYVARRVALDALNTLDLSSTSLLLWQAPLPQGETALAVEEFLAGGGRAIFFAPSEYSDAAFMGCSFEGTADLDVEGQPAAPTSWRQEGDLLRDGEDGTPLSVKRLEVSELTGIRGDVTPLARVGEAGVLLARAPTARGGMYLLGTKPSVAASNLASQGLVLVALVHRALADSAREIGSRTQQVAGEVEGIFGEPTRLSEGDNAWLLAEETVHAGVLQSGDILFALNRSEEEDLSPSLAEETMTGLMPGVDMSLVSAGTQEASLVDEVWRVFLILMLVVLIGEALLCLSESSPREATAS